MLNVKLIIYAAIFAGLAGCGDGDKKLNGKIVKTSDGKFYTVHHNAGDTYFIRPVDPDKLKSDAEFTK